MAKDPAVLWYWGDWQGGTVTLSRHLKGCYMDLLNAQFNTGHLSLDEIKTVLGSDFGSSWPTLQKKFKVDNDGLYFNERLKVEKIRRSSYTESRRNNLKSKPDSGDEPMGHHMENENDITVDELRIKKELFKKTMLDAGGLTYVKRMLDEFFDYWSEPNRSQKPKMRFELEKTWEISRRLRTWAKKVKGYQPDLTDSQRTIKQKQHEFSIQLEKHLEKYGKNTLNEFYKYWGQPENKPDPGRIRWEMEEFWDLPQRLSQWASRNTTKA